MTNTTTDDAYAQESAQYQARLTKLKPVGAFRRFVVSRMGSTGSGWLAKLLNSHPDVYCTQEAVCTRVYPATETTADDVMEFLEYLAWETNHYAYKAVGDVGSVWASHLAFVPFTAALLVRHPARVLATRLAVYPENQTFTRLDPGSRAAVLERWGIDLAEQSPMDRIFLHDCFIYDAQVRCLSPSVRVIRLEELQDMKRCEAALLYLTGLRYDRGLIKGALGKRVNETEGRAEEIDHALQRFSAQQRDWYQTTLAEAARSFGYELNSSRLT